MDFSKLLLYVPGIVIFLVGSAQTRSWLRYRKPGSSDSGTVVRCTHIVKKDKKGRIQYDYYDVLTEYTDQTTGHSRRKIYKSPNEYAEGQQVRIIHGTGADKTYLTEKEDEFVLHPLAMLLGGALLILLALEENRGNEVAAMAYLTAVLIGGGASLLARFISLKKKQHRKTHSPKRYPLRKIQFRQMKFRQMTFRQAQFRQRMFRQTQFRRMMFR